MILSLLVSLVLYMITDGAGVCRHGERSNCVDCLRYMLEDIQALLKNPDAPLLVSTGAYKGLVRQIDYAMRTLNNFDTESDVGVDEVPPAVVESSSLSPSRRLIPETVFGSAWAAKVLDTPKMKRNANDMYNLEKASPHSPGALVLPNKSRSKWTEAEVKDLRRAYKLKPKQWESMRTLFPSLKKYTGMQLKDKYKTL